MSKIKTFSFFIITLIILITVTYFLNKEEVSNNGISNFIEKSINLKSETEKSQVNELNEEELLTSDEEINDTNDVIEDQEENEDDFDNPLFTEEEPLPSAEENPMVIELRKLNQTADIAKNYVLNNQLYIDDKGFNLETINVMADNCDDCWTAELSYEVTEIIIPEDGPENYFKNIMITLQNEKIKEVIWEGQVLDINE